MHSPSKGDGETDAAARDEEGGGGVVARESIGLHEGNAAVIIVGFS